MSGYRTLHRIQPSGEHDESSPRTPIWRVRFSPCRSPPSTTQTAPSSSSLRLLTAGASNIIQCFSLADRTNKDSDTDDVLDASAMSVECTDCLVSKDYYNIVENSPSNGGAVRSRATLGYAALDIARNYSGADPAAGNEVVVASQMGGKVCVWVRLDPVLIEKGVTMADSAATTTVGDGSESTRYIQPHAEFSIDSATGTTLAIRPPSLETYHSKKDADILVALGCANGAVILCKTGIVAARPGGENAGSSSTVVGDSASSSGESVKILSNSTPGEIVATIGGGHCVMSLAFHPTIPNSFVVGRKDGTIDIFSSLTTAGDLSFRRMHRLVHSSFPIRALAFSQPDGALLFAGDDDGKLYSYDASCNNARTQMSAPVKLVACALTAHKGWIMNLTPFPDGRRVATCGSDRSVRVWDCGMGLASSTPVHSFEGAHDGLVWGVDCGSVVGASSGGIGGGRASGDRVKLISCGNDGVMQVFSCE